jgi:hypothetical protein
LEAKNMTSNQNAVAASALLLGSSIGFLVGRASFGALGTLTLAERVGVASTAILGAGGLLYSTRPTPTQSQPDVPQRPESPVVDQPPEQNAAGVGTGGTEPATPERSGSPLHVHISGSALDYLEEKGTSSNAVIEIFATAAPTWPINEMKAEDYKSTEGRGLVIIDRFEGGGRPTPTQRHELLFDRKSDLNEEAGVTRFGRNVIWIYLDSSSRQLGFLEQIGPPQPAQRSAPTDPRFASLLKNCTPQGSTLAAQGQLWSGVNLGHATPEKGVALKAEPGEDLDAKIAEAVEAIRGSLSQQPRRRRRR